MGKVILPIMPSAYHGVVGRKLGNATIQHQVLLPQGVKVVRGDALDTLSI